MDGKTAAQVALHYFLHISQTIIALITAFDQWLPNLAIITGIGILLVILSALMMRREVA